MDSLVLYINFSNKQREDWLLFLSPLTYVWSAYYNVTLVEWLDLLKKTTTKHLTKKEDQLIFVRT